MKISQMYHSNNLLYVYFYFLYELLLGRPKLYWSKILLYIIYIIVIWVIKLPMHMCMYMTLQKYTFAYIERYRFLYIYPYRNKSNSLGINISVENFYMRYFSSVIITPEEFILLL